MRTSPKLKASVRSGGTRPAQEQHLGRALDQFRRLAAEKYRKGAEEHNGDLLRYSAKRLIEEAQKETIDLWFYLHLALEKLGGKRR
jgi:hypothetical protein